VSGFVAVVERRAECALAPLIERLTATLAFRGPDGTGTRVVAPAALGETLLAADGPAPCGPHTIDGCAWLAGDVRIDAQADLRAALGAAGERPAANVPDATLVLHAYRAWGDGLAAHLLGDFSFAIWDVERATLVCARDAFGVKPLYYAAIGGTFVCSNTLETVLAHGAVGGRLHEPALVDFLRTGFNEDLATTTYADVHRLPPAHTLVLGDCAAPPIVRRHWSFPSPAPIRYQRADDYPERFADLLGAAVADRVRGERAGILLSGGLDSTAIAALARRERPRALLHAWTRTFDRLLGDREGEWAAMAASHLGISHTLLPRDDEAFLSHLADPAYDTAEPADFPTLACYRADLRLYASWAPVLLYGEDGDTLLAPPTFAEMWRVEPRRALLGGIAAYTLRHRRLPHLGTGLARRLAGQPARSIERLPRPAWLRSAAYARAEEARLPVSAPTPARAMERYLTAPLWQWLIENIDAGMTRVPLEIRMPLLDVRLVEYALAIPAVPWRQHKAILRAAMRGVLPEEIVVRAKTPLHGYFEAVVGRWRSSAPSLGPLHAELREIVDPVVVAEALQRGSTDDVVAAWRVLQLDAWLRHRDAPGAPACALARAG